MIFKLPKCNRCGVNDAPDTVTIVHKYVATGINSGKEYPEFGATDRINLGNICAECLAKERELIRKRKNIDDPFASSR